MNNSPAGVVTLAVAGLWVAYLVPQKLRHRQQLLESRTDDRFSGALRVLAVTDRTGRNTRVSDSRARSGATPDCAATADKRVGLLTPSRGSRSWRSVVRTEAVPWIDRTERRTG
ncbi:hypothetical protein [Cellulomonas sp. WB94]|uniref:hypothetical protein n=1 Tax=Cellulomonas sp. WB94 TaxID=2173174 RepID=UPI001F5BF4D5|nr:hypothetical protein [Cellulomonas sp. WB94]